jgi:catechol 2,3-dioxygenase-like lactoylglutathione lyase family enzyme
MINHLSLGIKSIEASKAFYTAALEPLGYVLTEDFGDTIAFGLPNQPATLWLSEETTTVPNGFHLAFNAPSQTAVTAFHQAAMAHGGTDNGAPDLRPNYSPTYYAAFAIDPDGYHLEAVHGR